MKNLEKINPFQIEIERVNFGILTTLTSKSGITTQKSISYREKCLLANYVYDENENYNLVYTLVDNEGNTESFVEEDGVLPTLFLSPCGEAFVYVQPYDPDKELDICIPIFHRELIKEPKRKRPFAGNFIGVLHNYSVLYDNWSNAWSDTKPDKLRAIEFKNGMIKKEHNSKIPLPKGNKMFIHNNEIHLLGRNGEEFIHRQIDEKGKEIQRRNIHLKFGWFREIINLSFDETSYLIVDIDGELFLEKILIDGKSEVIKLIDIKDEFYATFKPEKIADNTYGIRFTTEPGNGWFILKDEQLVAFYYSKGVKGYKNLLTNEILEMKDENLVLSGLNKTIENSYAVSFYPRTEKGKTTNKKLIIFNTTIKNGKC